MIQELQTIKGIKQHNINYQKTHWVRYVMYMLTGTNKQYSYPRVVVIRIDVHPTEENVTNTPHASHAQSAYGHRLYISHVVNA
jgi:hypothetical protein